MIAEKKSQVKELVLEVCRYETLNTLEELQITVLLGPNFLFFVEKCKGLKGNKAETVSQRDWMTSSLSLGQSPELDVSS